MLIVFQFPIVDLRALANYKPAATLPPLPPLTAPNYKPSIFPGFGWGMQRRRGGSTAFSDENKFYSAHKALLFEALGKKKLNRDSLEVQENLHLSRRLFIGPDGLPVRLEVDLMLNAPNRKLQQADLLEILNRVLTLPTRVEPMRSLPPELASLLQKESEQDSKKPPFLAYQAANLATRYALATSNHSGLVEDFQRTRELVRAGNPIVVVELGANEVDWESFADTLPVFKRVHRSVTHGADFLYGQIPCGYGFRFPCWFLGPRSVSQEKLRELRICLLRLYAEHRAVDEALHWHEGSLKLSTPPDPARMRAYFKSIEKAWLAPAEDLDVKRDGLLAAIGVSAAVDPETDRILLASRIKQATRNLQRRRTSTSSPQNSIPLYLKASPTLPVEPKPDLLVELHYSSKSSELAWRIQAPKLRRRLSQNPIVSECEPNLERYAREILETNKQQNDFSYASMLGGGSTIGQQVPELLWDLLAELENAKARPSLLLVTNEPYIPWELASDPKRGGAFLGIRARIGRWPSRALPPPKPELLVDSAAFVSGTYGENNLPAASAEAAEISEKLTAWLSTLKTTNVVAVAKELKTYLKAQSKDRLLHFAVHGNYAPGSAEDGLLLTDKSYFNSYAARNYPLPGRPLVFLNACEAGAARLFLGQMQGLAESFLNTGATAVIAPFWAVGDDVAKEVAVDFYKDAFNEKLSTAECLCRVRAKFSEDRDSPTYLAYKFYGHPDLQLRLTTKVSEHNESPT